MTGFLVNFDTYIQHLPFPADSAVDDVAGAKKGRRRYSRAEEEKTRIRAQATAA